jgi:hypothetical protein
MNPTLERLISLWREPVDGRADPVADFRAVYADPVPVNGTELSAAALVDRARMLQAAFADLRMTVVHDFELPGRIVVAFIMEGRHVGPYQTPLGTVAPTGREFRCQVTDILTIDGTGLVTDIWVISDDLGLLRQLDAVRLSSA